MITGIGIDIIEVERIEKKLNKENGFKKMVFSLSEIEYCEKNAHPAEHFAGRFAAKEAFLKALGSGFTMSYELNQIIVENDEKGAPYFKLSGVFEKLEKEWSRIHLSISHVKSLATAFVILEK